MENWLITLLIVAGLVVGFFGQMLIATPETIEVPVIEYQDKIVEVCGQECCPEIICEEPFDYLNTAVNDFMVAVEEEEDEAGDEFDLLRGYDFEEISVNKVYDEYTLEFLDEDEYLIDFTIKLKYKEDGERSEKIKYEVQMHYEEDEDTLIQLLE